MKFEDWWRTAIENNPLWKISSPNWKDAKTIAHIAYIEGMHHEFEKNLNESIRSKADK